MNNAPASTPSTTQPSPILVQDTQTPSSIQPTSQPESAKFASETSRVLRFIAANPAQVAGFIATHYLNSQMQSFLILPTSFRLLDSTTAFLGHHSFERLWYQCCSAIEYIRRMPYWHKWDGSIPSQAVLPLIINTLLITLGIHISWKNRHLAGMVPGLIDSPFLAQRVVS